ncbi:MAG: hypothetical protein KKD76_00715, partial [Verrucomicrobia bacterium]|nr:hypothetical protein [Verrucomicrobiota bacterium]
VQEGISIVGLVPSPKATCARAWVLSPDTEPFAAKVETVSQSGQVTLTLPKLRYWSVVVFEWTHK